MHIDKSYKNDKVTNEYSEIIFSFLKIIMQQQRLSGHQVIRY